MREVIRDILRVYLFRCCSLPWTTWDTLGMGIATAFWVSILLRDPGWVSILCGLLTVALMNIAAGVAWIRHQRAGCPAKTRNDIWR